MKQRKIKNFTAQFFIDKRNGKNDVVVMANGKELYRQPKTRENYFAGFDVYVREKFGISLSEYENRFKPAAA